MRQSPLNRLAINIMNSTTFDSLLGSFTLLRRPARHDKSLQAWDAADSYLLDALASLKPECANLPLTTSTLTNVPSITVPSINALVINDQFGALAVALNSMHVCSWNDSRTAHLALLENSARNQLQPSFSPTLLPGTELPTGTFDVVLWRIPKTLALFEQQLHALQSCTGPDTLILAGGMIKHMPEKLHELLRPLGAVEVLPAQKKARVFRVVRDTQRSAAPIVELFNERTLAIPELNLTLSAGPNVFARDKFDIGARFFIEQFAKLPRSAHIADLGCGNGVVGIMAKRMQPEARIEFFDDSYQAVAAAERNYRDNGFADLMPAAAFHVDDVFSIHRGEARGKSCGEPFDLILCNPPFHQGHVVGDQIAWQMFMQSREQLRKGGELWIVGNRHLQYHQTLKKLFGNCRQIAANAKFVVLAARA